MAERRLRVSLAAAIVIALLAGGAGFALRALLIGDQGPSSSAHAQLLRPGQSGNATLHETEIARRDAEIARLQQQLATQLEDRTRIEEKFQALRDEALELAAVYREESEETARMVAGTASALALSDEELSKPAHTLAAAKPQRKGVSMSALKAAGFGEVESMAIRERIESIALRQLYLTDTATREGWKKTPRFNKARHQIGSEFEEMREEYGDDRYDWILYAAGRKNRVVVDSVLGESAAAQAGLKPGDFVVGYADARIFNGAELRYATMQGNAGELVLLEYEREGVGHRTYVPRGPVGVQLHLATLPPAAP